MGSTRAVLEVLKLCSPSDLLRHLSYVSLQWRKLSTNTEVWQAYCEDNGIDLNAYPDQSALEAFRQDSNFEQFLVYIQDRTVKLVHVPKLLSSEGVIEYTLNTVSGPSDDNGYCLISRYRVIRFGVVGKPEVQDIDLRTGSISELPQMQVGRTYPGVYRHSKGLIYLFGGRTKVCEKFHLQSLQWELVTGKMIDPLEALTPARYAQKVYLSGSTTVEVFDIDTEAFSKLPFSLPIDWWYSLCLIDKQELVVVQSNTVSRWAIDSNVGAFRTINQDSFGSGYYSNCPPVWYQGEMYTLHNDIPSIQGVFAFSPQRNSLRVVLESL